MIQNKDRSGWFGASDTAVIMRSWKTKTFSRWWAVKLGLVENNFQSLAMKTGSAFEHRILNYIGIKKLDRQIRLRRLRLRVNLDGEDASQVYEVKTYGGEGFKLSRAYWMQCQVQMFATGKACSLVAYRLEPDDYQNWFRPIDAMRISIHEIPCDARWISEEYLPRLQLLADCLRKGAFPREIPS